MEQTLLGREHVLGRTLMVLLALSLVSGIVRAEDTWTGNTYSDDWSRNGNWLDASSPTASDPVIFNATGAGHLNNLVDVGFTIGGLEYGNIPNLTYVTDLNGSSVLQINGPVAVGTGGGAATWTNGGTVRIGDAASVWTLNVGTQPSATFSASLMIDQITLDAHLDNFYIGRKSSGSGTDTSTGSVQVAAGSTVTIDGTDTTKPNVYIGFNQDADYHSGSNGYGAAHGTLDALEGTVTMNLNELVVGYAYASSATGTLKWNQPGAILATSVYFGRGKGATGILDVPASGTFKLGTPGERVSNLRIAYDDVGGGTSATTNGDLDFAVSNPTFEAYVGSDLSIGRRATGVGRATAVGRLKLGSNSVLDVGTGAAPANVYIGFNQDADYYSGDNGYGAAHGTLDALEGTVTMNLNELVVGYAYASSATGTLRWNQPGAILATSVYFGRGKGATGILDVPAGGTFKLGTPGERVSNLRIAYDDSGATGGTTNGDLDFAVSNPTFEAYVGSDLSIGRRATGPGTATAVGRLKLGSNSVLDVGTEAAPANVYIGFNQDADYYSGDNGYGAAHGTLDALEGTVTMRLNELVVGKSNGGGTANGTFLMGPGSSVSASTIIIGYGTNASGSLVMDHGTLTAASIIVGQGGQFEFAGGQVTGNAVQVSGQFGGNGTITGDVTVVGGHVRPGNSIGLLDVVGNYAQDAASTLHAELGGTGTDQIDRLVVSGSANLGGTLDIELVNGFIPGDGDTFDIISGSVNSAFDTIGKWYIGNGLYFDPFYNEGGFQGVRLVVALAPPGPPLPHAGDITLDDKVDISDLGVLAANYGKSRLTWVAGDLSGDWNVDISDLGILAANYGYGTGAAPAVPEPASLALLGLGAMALIRRR